MPKRAVKVGVIGCGMISDHYLAHMPKFDILDVTACADIRPDRAAEKAQKHDVPIACSVEELLANPQIDIVVNLTTPQAHAEVSLSVLRAGKHLFSEKTLGVTRGEGRQILDESADNGLLVGCAPDTFLSGAMQTCRTLIDDGAIGEPIAASVSFMERFGHPAVESDRAFVLQRGGGSMLDTGVYYLTALVSLLGPIRWVTGMAQTPFPERVLADGPEKGKTMPVPVATHTIGAVEFVNGALASVVTSTDVFAREIPPVLVYGTNGTLRAPDPNGVSGPVHILRETSDEWEEVPLTHSYALPFRGIGVAELAQAIASGRPNRASGRLAYHVLDTMLAFEDSARDRTQVEVQSECPRPAPLPSHLEEIALDG